MLHAGLETDVRALFAASKSAIGGMVLSIVGMFLAAAGYLPPVWGAISQEIIDVLAVLNALRIALPPKALTDF